jgi:putative transposase
MGEYITQQNAPPHYFEQGANHIITACIYKRVRILDLQKKNHFLGTLFNLCQGLGWTLDAWVVLDNHYHIIVTTSAKKHRLTDLIRPLHSKTAKKFNYLDSTKGRKVWHNYWDTCLTSEWSYLSRMKYVMLNPVKHGFVTEPKDYPFSSYTWFVNSMEKEFVEKVLSLPIETVNVVDHF